MKKLNIILLLLVIVGLESCIVIGFGLGKVSDNCNGRKLQKINRKFDQDGWYYFEHDSEPELLYDYFIKMDSIKLSKFYQKEEFSFLNEHFITRSEIDTFTCIFPLKGDRKFIDFSSTRNSFILGSEQPRLELIEGKHCYISIGNGEVACCLITKDRITIPYILQLNDKIIARPKPYIPEMELNDYSESLVSIKEIRPNHHMIRVSGKKGSYVDTTNLFNEFLRNFDPEIKIYYDHSNIDTSRYELNHLNQYYSNTNEGGTNYQRTYFWRFNSISNFHQNRFKWDPLSIRYFPPDLKLVYKAKLDKFFKEIKVRRAELRV